MTDLDPRPRRRGPLRTGLLSLCLAAMLLGASPGCAALSGLVTGAFTGAVDAPMQVYRHNRSALDHHPEYWFYNVLVMGPVGFAVGPLAGFAKGLVIDIEWLLNRLRYRKAFVTYKNASVWRPYTIHW